MLQSFLDDSLDLEFKDIVAFVIIAIACINMSTGILLIVIA